MQSTNCGTFSTAVEPSLKGLAATMASLEQFDRLLASKAKVTTQVFAKLASLPENKFLALTLATRRASDKLQAGLNLAVDSPARVKMVLRELGPTFFTEDQGWRELISQVAALPPERNDFKLLALTKYRRYLTSRLEALNTIGCNRIESRICEYAHSVTQDVTQFADHPGITQELSSSETIVRDVVRLPRGRTAPLRAREQACVDVWLAKRRFRIEMWEAPSWIDGHGHAVALKEGRNFVGRALFNDVIIDARYPEVSRSHMILEMSNGYPVSITDMSSGGTYLPRKLVAT